MFNAPASDSSKSLFSDIQATVPRSLFSNSTDQHNKPLFSTAPASSHIKPSNLFALPGTTDKSEGLFSAPPLRSRTVTADQVNHREKLRGPDIFVDRDAASDSKCDSPRSVSDRAVPTHWPAVKLSRLPAGFNQKAFLQKHFERFGNIQKIICQLSLDAAYIAFDSVTSAQRAKRNGHTPLSDSDSGLPNTVLITLAQCRSRTNSSGSGTCLPNSLPSRSPVNAKRKLSPIKSTAFSKFPSRSVVSERNEASSPPKNLFNRTTVDLSIPPKQARTEGNMPLTEAHSVPRFACTVEERVSVLQAHQRCERERNPVTGAPVSDSFHHADGGAMEEYSLANVPNPIRGTCPDMCPELERYLRDLHQRVSVFECLPSTLAAGSSGWQMDHSRAVKDYERSSADQPTPLPCELRPTPVLQRTMAYLLASVADRPELDQSRNFWKPWYEFMWTRTRAIRKDVAQQRLCCPQIVGVMERIARFHIFCAARLVDQPVDSFDPRINSENLTQCLQTLKEMYNDLYTTPNGGGVTQCPCEAEFRTYMLLMKLNDQSALNEVQMLPAHLLRSNEIRFAVAVHEAVTTNNYIRFFRLARMATCLNACLMHRYFVQLRSRALLRLAASFAGHPKREVQYPVETLTRQLAFEDRREAQDFCESWGLSVVDGNVIFDKQVPPQPPELAWRERRAFQLIENKRSGIALSTLFNNGPVSPEDAQPLPVHSSFDSNGRFIGQMECASNAETNTEVLKENNPTVSRQIISNQAQLKPISSVASSTYPGIRFPLSEGFTRIHQLKTSTYEADRDRAVQMLKNQTMAWNFVTEWIGEVLEIEPVARRTLAIEYLAREFHSQLIEQILRSCLNEVVNSVVDSEQTSRLRELSVEIRDSLIQETIKREITLTAQTSLTCEIVLNEILYLDLLPCLTRSVAKSCLLAAEADAYYQRTLLRRCFGHIQAWMCRKAQNEQDRALLRSIPACPSVQLDALSLVGLRAAKKWAGLRRTRSARAPVADRQSDVQTKYPLDRFSSWASMVDRQITWSPITPYRPFTNQRIAIFLSFGSTHSLSFNHRQFCQTVLPWLRMKLIRFNLVFINEETEVLLKDLCTVLCVGNLPPSFSNIANTPDLPILVLQPSQWIKPAIDTVDSATSNLKCLTLPCRENGQFVPHPGWVSILQTGLDWVASFIAPQSIPSPLHETMPLANASLSQIPAARLQLTELVHQLIGLWFVRPITLLARDWSTRELVDPSLDSLLGAYRLVLSNLFRHIHDYPIRSRLEELLDIQSIVQPHFRSSPTSPNGHPWLQFETRWRECAIELRLSPDHLSAAAKAIEQSRIGFLHQVRRYNLGRSKFNILPDPVLVPWHRLCMIAVRDRLDKLVDSTEWPTPCLKTLEALVKELIQTQSHQKDESKDDALSSLVIYFTELGQPAMSVASALDLSVDIFRQRQIKSKLTSSIDKHHQSRDLKTMLESLSHRLDDVESSMSRTLEETEAYSTTSNGMLSLSLHHTCYQ